MFACLRVVQCKTRLQAEFRKSCCKKRTNTRLNISDGIFEFLTGRMTGCKTRTFIRKPVLIQCGELRCSFLCGGSIDNARDFFINNEVWKIAAQCLMAISIDKI